MHSSLLSMKRVLYTCIFKLLLCVCLGGVKPEWLFFSQKNIGIITILYFYQLRFYPIRPDVHPRWFAGWLFADIGNLLGSFINKISGALLYGLQACVRGVAYERLRCKVRCFKIVKEGLHLYCITCWRGDGMLKCCRIESRGI